MNNAAYIKQFQLIEFINENCDDDYLISKISIVLRRDKIEAPYYMVTKIKLSSCIDMPENGLIHAMDVLNHHRRYNLTEDAYDEIKSLIRDALCNDLNPDQVKLTESDEKMDIALISRNSEEIRHLFKSCRELFDKIDNLID